MFQGFKNQNGYNLTLHSAVIFILKSVWNFCRLKGVRLSNIAKGSQFEQFNMPGGSILL